MKVSAKNVLWLLTSFRLYVLGMFLNLLDYTSKNCCRNSSESIEKLLQGFIIIKKFNLQKRHFVYVYEVIIMSYPNFITYLYFSLALIRWNSSRFHLMELFKSKESFKEKVDSNNNWKTAWPRIILDWNLFLRLSLALV